MVCDAFADDQMSKSTVLPTGKRIVSNFAELFYEQVLIDIYRRLPTTILIDDGALIYSLKVAKN